MTLKKKYLIFSNRTGTSPVPTEINVIDIYTFLLSNFFIERVLS